MLMCPVAFLFGTSADDDPALGPVGPYLQQNDYSKYYQRKINRQSNSSTDYERVISFL